MTLVCGTIVGGMARNVVYLLLAWSVPSGQKPTPFGCSFEACSVNKLLRQPTPPTGVASTAKPKHKNFVVALLGFLTIPIYPLVLCAFCLLSLDFWLYFFLSSEDLVESYLTDEMADSGAP